MVGRPENDEAARVHRVGHEDVPGRRCHHSGVTSAVTGASGPARRAAPPGEILAAGGLVGRAVAPAGRGDRVWLAATPHARVVLRRYDPGFYSSWVSHALDVLSRRFPVPRPVPLFGGRCTFEHPTGTWEALSHLPGR